MAEDNLNFSCQQTLPNNCSFIIGTGARAKTIEAHKSILSRGSTVFASMFNGSYKEADSSFNIPLPNVFEFDDLKIILEYIYHKKTDSLGFLNLKRLNHVAFLADYFILDDLLRSCHYYMEYIVGEGRTSFHDFLHIFEYENKLGRKILLYNEEDVLQINGYEYVDIANRFPYTSYEIFANTLIYDLKSLDFYHLLEILASKLKQSERFVLIENYAKIHRLKMDESSLENMQMIDSSVCDDFKTPIKEKTLNAMFELINFKEMDAYEFKIGPAVSDVWIVAADEKLKILLSLVD